MGQPRRNVRDSFSGWNLYWVSSDGLEDCFVVARNRRSAMRVEREMNGFNPEDLDAFRVLSIPSSVARAYLRRKTDTWPWYAYEPLLKKLGAEFRTIKNREETKIADFVFSNGIDGPIPPRTVGSRSLKEFLVDPDFSEYGEEDAYAPTQMHLLSMLGICVARCQEIEYFIAHSFILGISKTQKRRYETINDLVEGWKKKTLGQLIKAIREGHNVEPMFDASLDLFLNMRNELTHGLTVSERYDISTSWGQDETVTFLTFFEFVSRIVRKAFRSTFYASIEFGIQFLVEDQTEIPKELKLTRRQSREIDLYAAFFTPKLDA